MNSEEETPGASEPTTATRRPYQAPRVLESATFETLALSCGKLDPGQPTCNPLFGGSTQNS